MKNILGVNSSIRPLLNPSLRRLSFQRIEEITNIVDESDRFFFIVFTTERAATNIINQSVAFTLSSLFTDDDDDGESGGGEFLDSKPRV